MRLQWPCGLRPDQPGLQEICQQVQVLHTDMLHEL